MSRVLAYRALPGFLLLMVRDYICFLWTLCIGLDLINVCSDKQQVHCTQLGDLLVPGGFFAGGDALFCCIHSHCARQCTQPSCIGYSGALEVWS